MTAAGLLLLHLFLFPFMLLGQNIPADENAAGIPVFQSNKEMQVIAAIVSTVVSKQHYQQKPMNKETSRNFFDLYIKQLDPQRMFFMQSDIDAFSKHRDDLCNELQKGNVDFAFQVFNCMTERWQEYENFVKEYLEGNIDLLSDDILEFDHSKANWAKNRDELKSLWKKRIKNDLIVATLMDRASEQEAAKEKKEKPAGDDDDKEINNPDPKIRKTPKERILYRVNQISGYYKSLSASDVLEGYLSRFAGVFDPHSTYMSPQTDEDFNIAISLSLVGIGAVLTIEDGYTKINEIVPGGPADLDGRLKAGDRIIAVQQKGAEAVDVINMPLNKVVEMIRGELGTEVTLTILEGSKGLQANPKKITIVRDKVQLKESEAKGQIHEVETEDGQKKKIGVIMLPSFYFDFEAFRRKDPDAKSSSGDVQKILKDFEKQKIDGLIVDLRSNGGGSLLEAINLSGMFIPEGPMVQVRDRKGVHVEKDQDDGKMFYAGPMIVMTNLFSASASEIFAAAMKDYRRCILVGERKTHGKGTVQTVSGIDRFLPFFTARSFKGGTVKLTNAKFYRINGESTQLKGVTPDIIFPSFTDTLENVGEDKLEYALEWDTIKPQQYTRFTGADHLENILPVLQQQSKNRMDNDPHFQTLNKNIAEFQRIQKKKSVSLNLEERWKEYLTEKQIQEEQDKIFEE